MSNLLTDFRADASERLWAWLEAKNVGYRDRLKPSIDTAGAQLEGLKPSLIEFSGSGLYAGPNLKPI